MVKVNKKSLLQWEKLLDLQVLTFKQSGRWLTKHLSIAIAHLPDREEFIYRVFKSSVAVLFLVKRSPKCKKKILSMLGSQPKSKWTTFLDNLNTFNDPNTLVIELLQILLQELISREKVCRHFWTSAFKVESEKLLLPTGTDFVGLGSNSSNSWCQRQVERLPFLTIQTTKLVNKSLQTTYCPSFMSSLVDKWENEAMPAVKLKTLRIKIYPTPEQKSILDRFIDTSRFVYNRTLQHIKNGHKVNFQDLRDLLVTDQTKKHLDVYKAYDSSIEELRSKKKEKDKITKQKIDEQIKRIQQLRRDAMKDHSYEKNSLIHAFELETPKDIRSCAVKRCCDAYTTGFSNLKNGNIKHFNLQYKRKKEKHQCFEMTQKNISIRDGKIRICPEYFKEHTVLKVHKSSLKKIKDLSISNNVDMVRTLYGYYLHLSIKTNPQTPKKQEMVAGVDLGIRTFATVHSNAITTNETVITEYKHRADLLRRLNRKKELMSGRIRKKQYAKIDKRKINVVDKLHWDFINNLLQYNDVVYLGDIKSHDIVKGGKSRFLNTCFNDLKFYKLKQRLLYKAYLKGKVVVLVPEHYTTQTCSSCGHLHKNIGSKEVFTCPSCNMTTGRDMNACKNMKLKGYFL